MYCQDKPQNKEKVSLFREIKHALNVDGFGFVTSIIQNMLSNVIVNFGLIIVMYKVVSLSNRQLVNTNDITINYFHLSLITC